LGIHPKILGGLERTQRKRRISAIKEVEDKLQRRFQEEEKKGFVYEFLFASLSKYYFANTMLNFDL
jgi:hypothetical protein